MIARPEDEGIKALPSVCDKCGSVLGGKDGTRSELYLTRLLLLSEDNVHSKVQFDPVYWQAKELRLGVAAKGNHHASHTTWADPKYLIDDAYLLSTIKRQ